MANEDHHARGRKESSTSRQPKREERGIDRRGMLKILGVAGATIAGVDRVQAAGARDAENDEDPFGILVDTTRCAGCRSCEFTCAEVNGLPEPDLDESVLDTERKTSERQWTLVNRFQTEKGEIYVKRQCMHCVQPACASACLTKAMLKTREGPVVWRGEKCMGCRFCMISCPFDVPKFEYHSANPRIQKCKLCWDRLAQGGVPACVENCPAEALVFGRRAELLQEARRRISENPDEYYPEIYGEHEAGGTSALYLSSVPFDQIGFRTDLGTKSYPGLTEDFLYGVPVVLTVLPAFLLGLSQATKREAEPEGGEAEHEVSDDAGVRRTA